MGPTETAGLSSHAGGARDFDGYVLGVALSVHGPNFADFANGGIAQHDVNIVVLLRLEGNALMTIDAMLEAAGTV